MQYTTRRLIRADASFVIVTVATFFFRGGSSLSPWLAVEHVDSIMTHLDDGRPVETPHVLFPAMQNTLLLLPPSRIHRTLRLSSCYDTPLILSFEWLRLYRTSNTPVSCERQLPPKYTY